MTISFFKYQGTGNDFVIIDNREGNINLTTEQIAHICHRRFGVGADGLMLLEAAAGFDFGMRYYNSDGNESSMCGNGGRCMVRFAASLGLIENNCRFEATDGPHEASILENGDVKLAMKEVSGITRMGEAFVLDTGSPHIVLPVQQLDNWDVVAEGRKIRNDERFAPGGINVNFVERTEGDAWKVRTYERGVEDETLSCGTGVTAVALAMAGDEGTEAILNTPGGMLKVGWKRAGNQFTGVYLQGPAEKSFEGNIVVND